MASASWPPKGSSVMTIVSPTFVGVGEEDAIPNDSENDAAPVTLR